MPRAFLSSTYLDLIKHRRYVIVALRKAGFDVDPMEDWPAAAEEPKVFSAQRVAGCDLFILLVAARRGYVPAGESLSVTQLEAREARKLGIQTLVFMLHDDSAWHREWDELASDPELRKWRAELLRQTGVSSFNLAPESIEVAPALTRWVHGHAAKQKSRTISVVSSSRYLNDEEIQRGIDAVNLQIERDFGPAWDVGARLDLRDGRPNDGDMVLYVRDKIQVAQAEGYHASNWINVPWAFVFLDACCELGEEWTVGLSRASLELLTDPDATEVIPGPHPRDSRKRVLHWKEVCDPVFGERYECNGIRVSNFVLPEYYSWRAVDRGDARCAFRDTGTTGLRPFGIKLGGFVRYTDPQTDRPGVAYAVDDDAFAQRAHAVCSRTYLQLRGRRRIQ